MVYSPIKKAGIVIIIIILLLSLSGCTFFDNTKEYVSERFTGKKARDEAVETVDLFFSLIINKNFEEAYQHISSGDKENRSLDDFTSEFDNITEIVSIEVNWVEVKNNIAIIGIDLTETYDGEEKLFKDIEVSLIREEDESWKVVFWD